MQDFDFEGLRKLKAEEGVEALVRAAAEAYAKREAEMNATAPGLMGYLERRITLDMVDNAWKEHLHSMDVLKQGIFLRGYGQRDPFQEYKLEGTRFFNDMIGNIKSEVTKFLFRVQVQLDQQAQPAPGSELPEGLEAEPQAAAVPLDPFTVRNKPQRSNRPMSRQERRKLEREEKKKNK